MSIDIKKYLTFKFFKKVFLLSLLVLTPVIIALIFWVFKLNSDIKSRLAKGWFLPPVEIYSAPLKLQVGRKIQLKQITRQLIEQGYERRPALKKIRSLEYSIWNEELCNSHISSPIDDSKKCIVKKDLDDQTQMIFFDDNSRVVALFSGQPPQPVEKVIFSPQRFAQFYGKEPILRDLLEIKNLPLSCLQAPTAIEDNTFLEHSGVSPRSIARAIFSLIKNRRITQGGSTITQQLVKNYFLTSERTFTRKFKEFFMAIILEGQVDKDKILESYLNIVYMGQNGPFQIRGFGAASDYYFSKPIEKLSLAECSLLAAIINSPGRFNPFRKAENALKRRNRVLGKMLEYKMIDQESHDSAMSEKLPLKKPKLLSEPAPYFVQSVMKKIDELGISTEDGLKIYTSLIPKAQEAAQLAIKNELSSIVNRFKSLIEHKKAGKSLESLIIAADNKSGRVIALVGGSSYRKTQYNRAFDSHRQIGSIMKPFVYLAALETFDSDGNQYTPLTTILDESFTHKYENQSWSPRNYSGKFTGPVPLFYALKNSMNVPTAKLGIQVGLNSVIDIAKRMGIKSKLKPLPSITLGAFEIYPWEVLQAYGTIARMGKFLPLRFIDRVTNLENKVLYEDDAQSEQIVAKENLAVLVGMMKQTILNGTGRGIRSRGFNRIAAGKTGTTSDTKDAWFAGFTPDYAAVVWVGYDDNTKHGLTGASGAVPIWTKFMKGFALDYPDHDFDWPEGVSKYTIPLNNYKKMFAEKAPILATDDIEIIIRKGQEPAELPINR